LIEGQVRPHRPSNLPGAICVVYWARCDGGAAEERAMVAQARKSPFTWSLIPIGLLVLGRWGLLYWILRLVAVPEGYLWGIATFLRLVLIGVALALEWGHWDDFFIARRNLGRSLVDGLLMTAAFAGVGWAYAHLTLGGVHWLPWNEWLPTFLAALIPAGLVEELEFRALLLGLLRRWRMPTLWANLLVGVYRCGGRMWPARSLDTRRWIS